MLQAKLKALEFTGGLGSSTSASTSLGSTSGSGSSTGASTSLGSTSVHGSSASASTSLGSTSGPGSSASASTSLGSTSGPGSSASASTSLGSTSGPGSSASASTSLGSTSGPGPKISLGVLELLSETEINEKAISTAVGPSKGPTNVRDNTRTLDQRRPVNNRTEVSKLNIGVKHIVNVDEDEEEDEDEEDDEDTPEKAIAVTEKGKATDSRKAAVLRSLDMVGQARANALRK